MRFFIEINTLKRRKTLNKVNRNEKVAIVIMSNNDDVEALEFEFAF